MIDYKIVNSFIGRRWVYIDNDCWSVFCEASLLIFGASVKTVDIPETSCIKKSAELFDNYFDSDKWSLVAVPQPGDAILFKSRKGHIIHIGLYVESGNVLHCAGTPTISGQTMYERLADILNRYHSAEIRRCK